MVKSVTVRAPASTSNLGSGFDTLGLAVNLYTQVTLRRGQGASERAEIPPIVGEAAELFFRCGKKARFDFACSISGNIPAARGLGASGALRAAVVAGLNVLAGARLDTHALLELVTDLEGHPDNASPALLGGCTVSGRVGNEVRCIWFAVSPRLKLVTLIPNFRVETEQARRLIPQTFSKADTAHSLNRAALIAAAFAARNYEALRGLFDDRLHQPYRLPLVPQLEAVIRAGEKAGAIGGFLSGSGSAIICLALENEARIAKAMARELPGSGVKILRPDNRGLRILRG
jgi:homoserine kinase